MFPKLIFVISILLTLLEFSFCFEIKPRIVNGLASKRGQFPYYALLESRERYYPKENFICGGSLLNEEFILTAAHCLNNVTKVLVHLGSLRQEEFEDGRQVFFARRKHFYVHPNYDHETLFNDIALIKLSRPATYSRLIQPVTFPKICEVPVGMNLTAVGNGYNVTDGDRAEILQYTTLTTISNSECGQHYDLFDKTSILCAVGYNNNSICGGDSGK